MSLYKDKEVLNAYKRIFNNEKRQPGYHIGLHTTLGGNMKTIIKNELEEAIRKRRARECFPIVNRGKLWYNRLTDEQVEELDKWYSAWLDAPETHIIPTEPEWLKNKLLMEEELW